MLQSSKGKGGNDFSPSPSPILECMLYSNRHGGHDEASIGSICNQIDKNKAIKLYSYSYSGHYIMDKSKLAQLISYPWYKISIFFWVDLLHAQRYKHHHLLLNHQSI